MEKKKETKRNGLFVRANKVVQKVVLYESYIFF